MSRASTHAARPHTGQGLAPVEPLELRQLLASLLVTNANASGAGSLSQAILDANAAASPSTIAFDIPGPGLHKIELPGGLPDISSPVDIDARTQPGYAGTPLVELDGMDSYSGPSDTGLSFIAGSAGAAAEGLSIVRFYGDGIGVLFYGEVIGTAEQPPITIRADDIGYDPSGTTPSPGNQTGIYVFGSNVVIGGPASADGNLIDSSFNPAGYPAGIAGTGIEIEDGNLITIQNNIIGTDPTRTADLGNAYNGIYLNGGTGNSILWNTIAYSGYRAILDAATGTRYYGTIQVSNPATDPGLTTSGNVLIDNGTNLADLALTSSAGTIATSAGQAATISYTITNNGPRAASNVQFQVQTSENIPPMGGDLIDEIPLFGSTHTGLIAIGAVTPSQGTVSGPLASNAQSAIVALGSLASGASATVTVLVDANTGGTDGLAASVTSDQFSPENGDSMTSNAVTIAGNPDLAVVALPTVGKARIGVPYTFKFRVTNLGTAGLTEADFAVSNALTPSALLDSVAPSVGVDFVIIGPSSDSPGNLGLLAPGASATVSITLTPTRLSPLIVAFATSPANPNSALDLSPVDNLAFAGVRVLDTPAVASTNLLPAQGNIRSVAIAFNGPLIARTADDIQNYKLTTTGPGKPSTVGLLAVQYNLGARTATLALDRPLARKGQPLRLTLSGLTGTDGSKLPAGGGVVSLTR